MLNRRELIKNVVLLGAMTKFAAPKGSKECRPVKKFKIGACDWSIGKDSDPGAFQVARAIGLDGIMVNMGSLENDLHLRQPDLQEVYLKESARTGISISSLALGELNNTPFKSDPRTEQWVSDSIDVAHQLHVPVILLAFFSSNDLRGDQAGKNEVIRRLRKLAPKAEQLGVTLGIESYLNAAEHLEIIEKVGSNQVKAYVDFRNMADAGYDVLREVKQLGKDNICELHIKENGFLLGEGSIDWRRIFETLYQMNYYGDGWMQIEWSMPNMADTVDSYRHNLRFLQELFAKQPA